MKYDAEVGCVAYIVTFVIFAVLGTLCLEYSVETLFAAFGNEIDVPLWNPLVWIAGFFLSETTIPVAVIVWVLDISGAL